MKIKKFLALLIAAALAVSLLAGCGGGKNQSLSQVLLNLLDGQYQNVSVEIDPDLEADLRQAIRESETEEELRAALTRLLGGGISFQLLGSGQKGDSAWNLILYPGTDPNAAARSVYLDLDKVFAALPADGQYTAGLTMVETENGYAILVRATVEKAGTEDKPDPVTLKSIAVTTPPTKTTYWVDETFDPKGMVITAAYSDSSTKTIENITSENSQGVSWTPDDALDASDTSITITYGGQTATVKVEVKEPEVEKIEVTTDPSKIEYQINDDFIPTGMVITATYTDGHKETIDNITTNGDQGVTWEPTTIAADTEKVTIKYQGKEAEVSITLTPPTLDGIKVDWSTEATYYTGDSITKSGVVTSVKADYSYGSDPTLKSDEYELTIKPKGGTGTATVITDNNPYKFDTAGDYTLTVTYLDEYQDEKTITVENNGYTDDGEGNYTVTTAEGLKAVADIANNGNLGINITLTADIDLTGEWTPIGTESQPYTGTFDGNGKTITGLTVTGSDQYAGLFGYIGENGTVKNVVLEGVQITSDNSLGDVGGVVGLSYGTIENCSVSGSVSGRGQNSIVGGVVGYQSGGFLTGCSSSATVNAGCIAGGVAGLTDSGATLTGCYATGDVTLESINPGSSFAGGVVGSNGGGTLTACYATGSVTGSGSGTIYAGGVTGTNDCGTLTACYHANGTVSGPDGTTGGVAGRNYKGLMSYGGIITACFWGSNGQAQGIGEDQVGTGGTTMVTDGDWQNAVDAMNAALAGNNYKWTLGTGGLPTLEK